MEGPTFYGEVLPPSSRAVDEEEDEEDVNLTAFRYSSISSSNTRVCYYYRWQGFIDISMQYSGSPVL